MAFEFIPGEVVVFEDEGVALHEANSFGEDVLGVQEWHLNYKNIVPKLPIYNHIGTKQQIHMSCMNIQCFVLFFLYDFPLFSSIPIAFLVYNNMGLIRSSPDTTISLSSQKFPDVNYLQASICGWQHFMEDFTGHAQITEAVSVFFVLDGHGGPDLAQLAAQFIPQFLRRNSSELTSLDQYKSAVEGLFPALDQALRKQAARCSSLRIKRGLPAVVEKWPTSGCSAALALVGANEIVIANVGECKAYVCYSSNPSKAVLISGNHSESNKEEAGRVKSAGGFFAGGRVNGLFPFTRSLGDYALKENQFLPKEQQLLVSTPSVFALRKQDIRMVVLGSGGLWERTPKVLKELTNDDLQLEELQQRARGLLEGLVSKNPRESEEGLHNMALLAIDVKST